MAAAGYASRTRARASSSSCLRSRIVPPPAGRLPSIALCLSLLPAPHHPRPRPPDNLSASCDCIVCSPPPIRHGVLRSSRPLLAEGLLRSFSATRPEGLIASRAVPDSQGVPCWTRAPVASIAPTASLSLSCVCLHAPWPDPRQDIVTAVVTANNDYPEEHAYQLLTERFPPIPRSHTFGRPEG